MLQEFTPFGNDLDHVMDIGPEDAELAFGTSVLRRRAEALLGELAALKRHGGKDAVHDTRVQSRRLRAALEAFEDLCPSGPWGALYASVRAVTRSLGRMRETEVTSSLLEELDVGPDPAVRLCREYLQERFDRDNRKQRRRFRAALREIKVKQLRSQASTLLAALESQECPPVPGGLPERRHRIITALAEPALTFRTQRSFARAGDAHLHRLRIAVKKLRYAMEIFAEIQPGELQSQIADARALQDAAGRHQDWAVLREHLRREIRRLTRQKTGNLAFQTGRVLQQVEDGKRQLRARILPALVAVQESVRQWLDATPERKPGAEVAETGQEDGL